MTVWSTRTFLYAPAHRQRLLAKALGGSTSAEAVIVDLEDGVPVNERAAAESALAALSGSAASATPALCRIRAGRARRLADVAIVPSWFRGVVLAKAEDPEDLALVADAVAARGLDQDIWLLVESALGVERLPQMLSHGAPVAGIMIGEGDLRADLGLFDVADERALDHAKLRVVFAAVAAGVREIVDGPDAQIEPDDAFREATRRTRDLGFTGRAAIHPAQLPAIEDVYVHRYTDEQVAWARSVLGQHDGASRMDGELVDEAVKRWARQILHSIDPRERTV
jgi:citrate lyase subunit beta/citryl-CoA lyase